MPRQAEVGKDRYRLEVLLIQINQVGLTLHGGHCILGVHVVFPLVK